MTTRQSAFEAFDGLSPIAETDSSGSASGSALQHVDVKQRTSLNTALCMAKPTASSSREAGLASVPTQGTAGFSDSSFDCEISLDSQDFEIIRKQLIIEEENKRRKEQLSAAPGSGKQPTPVPSTGSQARLTPKPTQQGPPVTFSPLNPLNLQYFTVAQHNLLSELRPALLKDREQAAQAHRDDLAKKEALLQAYERELADGETREDELQSETASSCPGFRSPGASQGSGTAGLPGHNRSLRGP